LDIHQHLHGIGHSPAPSWHWLLSNSFMVLVALWLLYSIDCSPTPSQHWLFSNSFTVLIVLQLLHGAGRSPAPSRRWSLSSPFTVLVALQPTTALLPGVFLKGLTEVLSWNQHLNSVRDLAAAAAVGGMIDTPADS